MLLRKWLYAIILLICSNSIYSQQLTLGNTPYALKKSAVLELNSNNQGLLMPRISDTNLINALLPPDGMLIFHTGIKQIMVRTYGAWQVMPTNGNIPINWYASGNSGTNPAVHFLGTIDDKPMIIKSNNQVFWEFGRRQTLGLTQAYPDYTDDNEKVTHLKSALQFEAAGAQFYKPKMFVDVDGNFRMKGSSAGTDYFEFGSTGSNNNGGFEFVIGDDGNEPIVFKSYDYNTPPYFTEIMRLQSGKMGLGTTTPTEKLDVSGNIRFSGALMPNNSAGTSGYVLKSNGAGTAPTWVNPSTLGPNIFRTSVTITDGTAIVNTTTRVKTVTVNGANLNAAVIVNPREQLGSGLTIAWARVSAANSVQIGFTNTSPTSVLLNTVIFDITIIQ